MYRIGLDVGIASVGWAVVDEDYSVVDLGVRLFDSADPSMNSERRTNRGTRRLLRRKGHRLILYDKFWNSYAPKVVGLKEYNPLLLRNKGIQSKLSIEELYVVLRNLLKHRGISYLDDALDENSSGTYQKALTKNAKELDKLLPCQIQLNRLNKHGKYRGDNVVNEKEGNEEITLSNVFTINGYINEIKEIFEVQKRHHSFINDDFINQYLEIFSSKRKYYIGPGNEKSRTDYGIYTTKVDEETGDFITDENIFEKLIGRCSVYKDKLRASIASYTAQEFNLLNDLNNLTINGRKLTEKEKREVIHEILESKRPDVKKIIKKVVKEEITNFSGARIDKSGKEIFHSFETYRKLRKEMEQYDIDLDKLSRDVIDEISYVLTINTEKDSIIKMLKKINTNLNEEVLDNLANFRKKNSKFFTKWHAFSRDIMLELMDDLYKTSKNQMELLTEIGHFKTSIEKFKDYNQIPVLPILEAVYNPVVKRSVNQSIKVLNAIISKYGYPQEIIIEMPRDKNDQEKTERIKKTQLKNEKELENIINEIKNQYGVIVSSEHFYQHKALKTKLRLWHEQKGICVYSGKPIAINQLLNNKELFEVDHIIPISISFDDSRNNKVLVYRSKNQKKGNRTPFMYLEQENRDWNYEKFTYYIEQLYKDKNISNKKKDNLLFKENITKQEVVQKFISRNLNDTRYASRIVLNTLQGYIKAHNHPTKIKVINGSFTSQLRNKLDLPKNREDSFNHHAIDAVIMCYSKMGLDKFEIINKDIIDYETGEIFDQQKFKQLNDETIYNSYLFYKKIMDMKIEIVKAERIVRYSYKVDKKVNRKLSNETIYGVREKENKEKYKISKVKNIYDRNGFEVFKKKLKEDKDGKSKLDDFLMYHHDKKTFESLLKVIKLYPDKANPFAAYREEYGEPIRKYSKKGNGPFVKSLKYYDGKIGSHIDISHKYGHKIGSKKVILDSLNPYRTDVYFRESDQSYHLAGIKYANFKFIKGKYKLDEEMYNKILIDEGILCEGQSYKNIDKYGFVFLFSLYKNDLILYEKNGEEKLERFLSRTMPNNKNYIETKPVESKKFEKPRNLVGLSKTKRIVKVNTDVLGNRYYSEKEKFNLEFTLDK